MTLGVGLLLAPLTLAFGPVLSLNVLLTSTAWRNDHNGFSHQGPGLIQVVLTELRDARERFGEIAALRAIGVARRRLLTGIVMEGLALAGSGCVLGLPLGLLMAVRLDRILMAFPGLPARLSFFVFDPERVAAAHEEIPDQRERLPIRGRNVP